MQQHDLQSTVSHKADDDIEARFLVDASEGRTKLKAELEAIKSV